MVKFMVIAGAAMDAFEVGQSGDDVLQHILMVEDDPVFQIGLRARVDEQAIGQQLVWHTARSLAETRERLHDLCEPPDLILLDLNLLDSKGTDTWRAVTELAPDIPIVILTGDDDDTQQSMTLLEGAQDYLIKGQEQARSLFRILQHAVDRHTGQCTLREVKDKLAENQRMASIGLLAGGVAHEFNNLNTIILGNVERQLNRTDLDDDLREALSKIQTAAQHSADVTEGLLSLVRQRTEKLPTSLRLMVEQSLRMARGSLEREGIIIGVAMPDEDLTIMGCPGMLGQALMNLLMNAQHALNNQPVKRIQVSLTTDQSGMLARLEVRDTGCGMSPELAGRIFEPFVTTKHGQCGPEGTGLGLATVRTIVDDHNGLISCASTPGEGATFTITLPLYLDTELEDELVAEPAADSEDPETDGKTALVVDDEEYIRELIASALKADGWSVICCANGAEALGYLERGHADVLVVDRQMPVMDGVVFLQSLREREGKLPPTLVCSGWLTPNDMIDLQQLGVDGTLRKPFQLYELRHRVAELATMVDDPIRSTSVHVRHQRTSL